MQARCDYPDTFLHWNTECTSPRCMVCSQKMNCDIMCYFDYDMGYNPKEIIQPMIYTDGENY